MKWLTPAQFAAACDRKGKALQAEVKAGLADTLTEARAEAVKRSSGTLTAGMLRKMGHPYATRAPNASVDPSTINAQTGEFRRAWKKAGPRLRGGALSGEVVNTSKVAPYLLKGTKRMIKRPIAKALADAMRPRFKARMRTALRRGLRA
jgi:hypothetical protein